MGFGDDVLGTGFATGLHARGKRAAFGDGKRIIWGPWSEEVFRYNPNVAHPGSEGSPDLVWIDYYKGKRGYNSFDLRKQRWVWNYDFKAKPGEFFFSAAEFEFVGAQVKNLNFIYVEPNVPWHKSVAVNKDWGKKNYQAVVDLLLRDGITVVQSRHGRDKLNGVRFVETPTYRHAIATISFAAAALVPEGGLHHGAAAVDASAVVIFGGFIPPNVTGYSEHVNLTGGVGEACGSLQRCPHCRSALDRISVEEVYSALKGMIGG